MYLHILLTQRHISVLSVTNNDIAFEGYVLYHPIPQPVLALLLSFPANAN